MAETQQPQAAILNPSPLAAEQNREAIMVLVGEQGVSHTYQIQSICYTIYRNLENAPFRC